MRVAVGSTNPVKRRATEGALNEDAVVEAVAVDSGVADQPRSTEETVRGAKNRAHRSIAAGEYDLGVGIEGGVASVPSLEGLYLTMWAAVTDGERIEVGAGPRIRLPETIAEPVREGRELGPLLDEVLGTENLKEGRGAVGVFTGDRIGREDALRHAVAVALGPITSIHYD